ncbi:MAG: UDP-N-acetylmuramate--L-alanine ligase, partial [Patescibacteria group bacterium]
MFDNNVKNIYMVGIKGTGMSSLAVLLKKLGYQVSGSDTNEHFFTEIQLKNNEITYYDGFDQIHLEHANPDLIITSTAYNDRNPEVSQAKLMRLSMISYPEAVGEISKKLTSVAVCGSHGKTTTTSMLGTIMQTNRETITLTGTVAETLNGEEVKHPKYFVFEADEYQNKFQYYSPANVILTNIDFDHPDFFTDLAHYTATFRDFLKRTLETGGFVVYNYDDRITRTLMKELKGNKVSYGFGSESDYRIANVSKDLNTYTLRHKDHNIITITLNVYGEHNILNSAASVIMSLKLGISLENIQQTLKDFKSVKRRMEVIPSEKYIILDDYGHHPTEIIATLRALRNKYKDKQIVAVFHPHTFTRTKAFLKEFGGAFSDADLTLVLDIYPSAREIIGTISTEAVVEEIKKNGSRVMYTPTIPDAAEYIKKNILHGSVILTIGAGDVWKL